jgi:hypothetical protein
VQIIPLTKEIPGSGAAGFAGKSESKRTLAIT